MLSGLKQSELAVLINKTERTISNIENNVNSSLKTYCMISEVLDINVEKLFDSNFDEKITETIIVNVNKNYDYKKFNFMKYRKAIGKNVVSYRKFRELTQEELAEKAGISPVYVKKIENLKTTFRLEILGKLADALDIDIRLFFKEN